MEEFKRLGRQFADTLEGIFNSEEARRVETEVRAGMKSFADEMEKAFNQAKDSPTAVSYTHLDVYKRQVYPNGIDSLRTNVLLSCVGQTHPLPSHHYPS